MGQEIEAGLTGFLTDAFSAELPLLAVIIDKWSRQIFWRDVSPIGVRGLDLLCSRFIDILLVLSIGRILVLAPVMPFLGAIFDVMWPFAAETFDISFVSGLDTGVSRSSVIALR